MIKIIGCKNGTFMAKCYGLQGAEYDAEHWWAGGSRDAVAIAVAAHIANGHGGIPIPVLQPPNCAVA
jgi:hypothetical protein